MVQEINLPDHASVFQQFVHALAAAAFHFPHVPFPQPAHSLSDLIGMQKLQKAPKDDYHFSCF